MQSLRSIKLLNFSLFVALIFIISCKSSNFTEVINSLKNLDKWPKNANQVYLVIPNGGCEGCISYAENFVKEESNKYADLKIVFTKINSRKKLINILGDTIINRRNIILDLDNSFASPHVENEIYPVVIYTDKSSLIKIEYQSPSSNGIDNLRKYYESRN